MHFNPGSLKSHIDEIRSLIKDVNIHVIAVSETWFTPKLNSILVNISGYTLVRHDRLMKRGGGVALYVKAGIKFRILSKSRSNAISEYLVIELNDRVGTKVAFAVVYNPPANFKIDPLKKVLDELTSKYHHVITVGDFNINLLGTSSGIRHFKEFLVATNLTCPSSEPTNFLPLKQPSQIDLILVKDRNLLSRSSQCSLGSFTSHDLLFGSYMVNMNTSSDTRTQLFRDFNHVDQRKLISAAIAQDWDHIYSFSEVDDQVDYLTK